jgi:tripartite-type tricarboxylate transporter receptor subunit TctC
MKNVLKSNTYVLVCGVLLATAAAAQDFPTRPLRMIVGFPPGGPTDLVARLVAQHLTEAMAHQVVIDNRPGAGGAVAGQVMAKAAPDGYTLFLASNGEIAISPSLYKKMAYDPAKDLAPVSCVGAGQLAMLVYPGVAAQSVKELIALAKAKPGAINYGSSGVGSTGHLAVELFTAQSGTVMLHVPYKGAGPAMTDVMGGQIQLIVTGFSSALPHIKSGKLRALGVTGLTRVKSMPELPAIAETLSGYQALSWYGLFATVGTPEPIVKRIHGEIAAMVKRADMNDKMTALGIEPEGSTPREFMQQLDEERAKWAKIIKLARVPLQ